MTVQAKELHFDTLDVDRNLKWCNIG